MKQDKLKEILEKLFSLHQDHLSETGSWVGDGFWLDKRVQKLLKLLTPQVEMGEKFSWERPIEEELLSFVEHMIRIWRNIVSSNENYTERRGLAKLFDNNSVSRARIEGMICAYETVSKQISKEVSLRQRPNKGDTK